MTFSSSGAPSSDFDAVNDDIRRIIEALSITQTPVVPSWTGASTNPAIGNGTITGNLLQFQDLRFLQVRVLMGSTTTFGSGLWSFGLENDQDLNRTTNGEWTGAAYALDTGTAFRAGTAILFDADTGVAIYSNGGSAAWQNTVPHTWANGDELIFSILFRVDESLNS